MQFFQSIRCSFPWHIREKFGQIRDGEASVFADFHLNLPYEIGSHDAGATAAFVVHVISTTFKLPTPSLLRRLTLACECRLVGYSWPLEIGLLHGSYSRRDFQCALSYFNNSNLPLRLKRAVPFGNVRETTAHAQPSSDLYARNSDDRNLVLTYPSYML